MKTNDPRKLDFSKRQHHSSPPPVSDAVLALFLGILAAVLVLGYLFLNKLVDISHQEDCILAHRKDCAAIELPSSSLAT